MISNLTKGMGFRTMAEGFLTNSGSNGAGGDALSQLGGALKPAVERLTSGGEGQIAALVEAIQSNPAIAAAVADALAKALPTGSAAPTAAASNGTPEKPKAVAAGKTSKDEG